MKKSLSFYPQKNGLWLKRFFSAMTNNWTASFYNKLRYTITRLLKIFFDAPSGVSYRRFTTLCEFSTREKVTERKREKTSKSGVTRQWTPIPYMIRVCMESPGEGLSSHVKSCLGLLAFWFSQKYLYPKLLSKFTCRLGEKVKYFSKVKPI